MASRLAYIGMGMALMYFLDPQSGRRRRKRLGRFVRGHGFYVEKTIRIEAPVTRVFAFWRNVDWEAELLNVSENREMTWRSVPDARVEHTGRVRFEPDGTGTRVHVQLRYFPVAGAIGHFLGRALGVDPEREMDNDLRQLKSLVETPAA